MSLEVDSPLTEMRGIGPARARSLGKAGLRTLRDLLLHLPFRYEDRRHLSAVGDIAAEGTFTLTARVGGLRRIHVRRRGLSMVKGWLEDDTGRLSAVWFNRPYLMNQVNDGERYLLHGRVRLQGSRLEMLNASLEPADRAVLGGRVVAVYNSVGGLGPALVRRLVQTALTELDLESLEDDLPSELRQRYALPTWGEALRELHRPGDSADVELLNQRRSAAHRRLIYGEFLELQIELGLLRSYEIREDKQHRYELTDSVRSAMREILPFQLTDAQEKVLAQIVADLESPHPMLRLLQGDVGSGKTIVAALALVAAMESGLQGAFMAPTELLAEQHFRTLQRLLARRFELALMTGSAVGADSLRAALATGDIQLAVGTHALIQEGVLFDRLGLAVVDEQHRFGVTQRQVLNGKRAKIKACEHSAFNTEMIQQAGEVTRDVVDVVGFHLRRCVRLSHAAHIRRDDPVPGCCQCGYLPVPAEPDMRETMAKHHRQASALLHVVHVQPVDACVMVCPVQSDQLTR